MNTLRSTEFRKQYASISEPTVVTVLGRPIGLWLPGPVPAKVEWQSELRAQNFEPNGQKTYERGGTTLYVTPDEKDEEIHRLKQELAKRPVVIGEHGPERLIPVGSLPRNLTTPTVTNAIGGPQTAPARGVSAPRQRLIDATLASVNRKSKVSK